MSAAAESSRPRQKLGELLVEAGLLAPAALELALEEQQQTGRTLGQILVGRGFLPAPTVAAALAEQSGGLLKTEYGYATGLAGLRRTTPAAPPPPPPVTSEEPTNVVPLDVAPAEPEPAEPERVAPRRDVDVDDLRARHDALIAAHAQLEAVIGERDRRISELEDQLAVLQASHGEAMVALASARTAAEGERQRFEEMLPELARSTAETVELRRQLAEEAERRAHSEGALAERSRIEDEIARLALAHAERDDRKLTTKVEEQAAALATAQAEAAAAEARAAHAESQLAGLRATLEEARSSAAQPARDAEHEAEVAAARARATEAESQVAALRAAMDETRAAADATYQQELAAVQERAARAESQVATLQAALGDARAAAEAGYERDLAAVQERAAQAESELTTLRAELEDALAAAAQPVAASASITDAAPETRHLLFVPTSDGYELVERDGAPPELGAELELNGRGLRVVHLAPSPLPRDRARCAYLERIPENVASD